MITVPALDGLKGVRHGFMTREGGVSAGIYASLNCGFGSRDRREDVAENRARALARLDCPAEALATVHQRHTREVVVLDGNAEPEAPLPVADALVTAQPGRVLGILTADCAPVLFADGEAGIVAAAHAGWRGALDGIVENTIAAMIGLGARASRIVAAVGPCIGQKSYQVGPEFASPFIAEDAASAGLFTAPGQDGRRHFDLAGYVARRLARHGLREVVCAPFDTCADERRFFSYRRATLRGEPDYGRQLSLIALAG